LSQSGIPHHEIRTIPWCSPACHPWGRSTARPASLENFSRSPACPAGQAATSLAQGLPLQVLWPWRFFLPRPTAERRTAVCCPVFFGHLFCLRIAILMEGGRIPNRLIAGGQVGRLDEMLPRFIDIAQRIER